MKHSNHAQHYTPEPVSPFTHEGPDLYDVFAFCCACVCLTICVLAYFDVLTK
jgi:hypothetical protein